MGPWGLSGPSASLSVEVQLPNRCHLLVCTRYEIPRHVACDSLLQDCLVFVSVFTILLGPSPFFNNPDPFQNETPICSPTKKYPAPKKERKEWWSVGRFLRVPLSLDNLIHVPHAFSLSAGRMRGREDDDD